ncbi:dolichol monophosphate mannose synthase [Fusobacterium nucleatum YWH7199]|uniref:glycosyltransferase family 2 protein n=1 Tax=Fusobacterium nucleatum TaxID=851 RepID=UPI00201ACD1F|nr:glycosyltransferase family 2 protein [Fusobacterium nucleatum]MCL4581099.1 dolichol monophosphate mannose synthase [Fusobacterium nucleatum YWH7199]
MKKISVCIPCYNEEKNIQAIYEEIIKIFKNLPQFEFEIIFSDNASTDRSVEIIRNISSVDKRVKAIINSRNYGPGKSGTNCCFRATGDCVVLLPCDLQDPPELISEFLKYWEEGWLVVWGQKKSSEENPILFKLRTIHYRLINFLSNYPMYKHVTGFGIMDRKVLEEAKKYKYSIIGLKTFIMEVGYKVKLVQYSQRKRKAGKSSYSVFKYFRTTLNLLFETSSKPIKWILELGFIFILITFLVVLFYFIKLYFEKNSIDIEKFLLWLFLAFLGSIQLLTIGILGRYIIKIFERVSPRPLVIESETINMEEDNKGNNIE